MKFPKKIILLFNIFLFIFACNTADYKKDSKLVASCQILLKIDTIKNKDLITSIYTKGDFINYLKSIDYSNYELGVGDTIDFINGFYDMPQDFKEAKKMYHRFNSKDSSQELVIFEVMQHDKEDKYKQEGHIYLYTKSNSDIENDTCSIENMKLRYQKDQQKLFYK